MFDVTAILAKHGIRIPTSTIRASALESVDNFGPNPGNLRMLRYVPETLAPRPALMVVLHGCTQTASAYNSGSGWSALADRYGFVLLFPEQQRANNPNGCFNWFQPGDVRRGQGEVCSIRNMVDRCTHDHGVDKRRVFITGLSAGGAMASAMLACYPDVFAGGAIIAGLPFGAASDVRSALQMMSQSPSRSADNWGALVRQASPHPGPWPRVSVWHGGSDATVVPANAREIVKQWTNVHGVADTSTTSERIDGFARRAWTSVTGDEVVELYDIPGMAHGTPLATGAGDNRGGAPGPYMLEAGISSSYHIARFFRLTDGEVRAQAARETQPSASSSSHQPTTPNDSRSARPSGIGNIDIAAVIAKALKAAGLTRSR